MKRYVKYSFIIGLLLICLVIIKNRRITKSVFNMMVLVEETKALEFCLKAKNQEIQINLNTISKDSIIDYSYYLDKYGYDLCSNEEKLKEKIEVDLKKWYRKQWYFIY